MHGASEEAASRRFRGQHLVVHESQVQYKISWTYTHLVHFLLPGILMLEQVSELKLD